MKNSDYDHPFADYANRLQYMPWMLPGPSIWSRIMAALRWH